MKEYSQVSSEALLIYHLRLYKEKRFILESYRYCVEQGISFSDHMKQYHSSPYCNLTDQQIEDIINWVEILNSMDETPEDWTDSYLYRVDGYDPDDPESRKRILAELDRCAKENHEHYAQFLESL